MPGRRCATLSWRDATVLAADHEPLMAAFGTRRVVDTDVRRRAQVPHGLLHRADVELEAAPDARVAANRPVWSHGWPHEDRSWRHARRQLRLGCVDRTTRVHG